jgi:hypothetical protein
MEYEEEDSGEKRGKCNSQPKVIGECARSGGENQINQKSANTWKGIVDLQSQKK